MHPAPHVFTLSDNADRICFSVYGSVLVNHEIQNATTLPINLCSNQHIFGIVYDICFETFAYTNISDRGSRRKCICAFPCMYAGLCHFGCINSLNWALGRAEEHVCIWQAKTNWNHWKILAIYAKQICVGAILNPYQIISINPFQTVYLFYERSSQWFYVLAGIEIASFCFSRS